MSRIIALSFAVLLLLSACGPSPEAVAATAQALAGTQIAATQTAQPTNTPQPTATPTATASATETAPPSETPLPSPSPTPTLALPTVSATPWINPSKTAPLRFENNSGEEIFVILQGPNYGEYRFTKSWNLTSQWGDYSYLLWIGNEGPYAGSFVINNADKHTLVIETDKVHFLGP